MASVTDVATLTVVRFIVSQQVPTHHFKIYFTVYSFELLQEFLNTYGNQYTHRRRCIVYSQDRTTVTID